MDDTTVTVLALAVMQAIQLAQTSMLSRTVRKSLRPPPPPPRSSRGVPVVFDHDDTPSERVKSGRRNGDE